MRHIGKKQWRHRRGVVAVILAAVALGAGACQSPLQYGESDLNSDVYFQSLLARHVAANGLGRGRDYSDTYIGPITQMVRVDEAGPGSATAPTTGPSIANASRIGMPYAALNMDEPVVGLSLQDAIARTARHSLAIKVEAYTPAIKEAQIIEAEAAFDPVFFGASQWSVTDEPQVSPGLSNGQSWLNQFGIRKTLPSGAQVQASTSVTYRDVNAFGVTQSVAQDALENSYTANIGLQITQPLLRGFGKEVNEANIYLTQRDARISLSQFKQQVLKNVADVEEAYQNLILARTNVEVLQRLVVSSEQTYNLIVQRKDLDATKFSISQTLAALETHRADLHVAQKTYRVASDRLKTLINDPSLDINSNILINPTDQPIQELIPYSTADCIETALRQRPEMQQAKLQIERANIVVRVSKNDLLPKADLTLSAQSNGLSNDFDRAFSSNVNPANFIDFAAGIKLEFPLGNRAAEAALERHQNERRQAIDNMIQISQQVVLDVKTQLREVLSTYAEIAIRERVRLAAADEFEGIVQIEDIRARTPEFLNLKLNSQTDLARAEQELIQAIVNYNLAIMRLELAKGTLLEYDQVSLDRPARTPSDNDLSKLRFLGSTKNK